MNMNANADSATCLGPYRVLDLTGGGCQLCGKILGDLGADVIKIEPPGGDASRKIGPFLDADGGPEKSLFWMAYNANKRGITLDVEKPEGRDILLKLVKKAHFLVECYPPGHLDQLGLGYSDFSRANPGLIMASITPFGQKGPYANYKGSDLVTWALSGYLYLCGEPEGPPTWLSWPQASLQAAAEAAAGALIAHWHRVATGEGQQVDVSIQESAVNFLWDATPHWDVGRFNMPRVGNKRATEKAVIPIGYPCKDGFITITLMGGGAPALIKSSRALVKWMDEEGMAPEWLKTLDWEVTYDAMKLTQDIVERVSKAVSRFFVTKTKAEIFEGSVKRGIVGAPVYSAKDICESPQFKARGFWERVEQPEMDQALTYCGPFLKMSETPLKISRRAPRIGEHNAEIYEGELRMSKKKLGELTKAGVI